MWTEDLVMKFIQLYKAERVLWDPKHATFKNKMENFKAWENISDKLNISVVDLKRKKETLMTLFRVQNKKKLASPDYIPVWAYYEPMAEFLGEKYDLSFTIKFDNTEHAEQKPKKIMQTSTNKTSKKIKLIERVTKTLPAPSNNNINDLSDANMQITQTLRTLNNLIDSKNKEDECDLYGKLIAKRLRKLPESKRQAVMYEIDGILLNETSALNSIENEPVIKTNDDDGITCDYELIAESEENSN